MQQEPSFDADLEEGFSNVPTETPVAEPQATQQQDETPSAIEAEAPKFRSITEDEYTRLMDAAAKVEELKQASSRQIDTVFGKIGGIERILRQIQETPKGEAVEISDADFQQLRDSMPDFPEIAEANIAAFKNLAGKMRGGVDDGRIREAVLPVLDQVSEATAERIKRELAEESLNEAHDGWQQIVGLPNQNGAIPQTDFRKWLHAQGADYEAKVLSTYNATTISKALDKFKESLTKQAKDQERRERMAQAVTPSGDGGRQASFEDDDAAFDEGFKTR